MNVTLRLFYFIFFSWQLRRHFEENMEIEAKVVFEQEDGRGVLGDCVMFGGGARRRSTVLDSEGCLVAHDSRRTVWKRWTKHGGGGFGGGKAAVRARRSSTNSGTWEEPKRAEEDSSLWTLLLLLRDQHARRLSQHTLRFAPYVVLFVNNNVWIFLI